MQAKNKEIIYKMCEKKKQLDVESELHGGYEKWFDELEGFREQLKKYGRIHMSPDGRENVVDAGVRLQNGHYVDHHISAYFMPLFFRRVGFELKLRTPAEQLIYVSEKLKERGIRFLYVALPNKKCIYPEFVADSSFIPDDGIMIPQCRKMIGEMIEGGMEVLDLYPDFLNEKNAMLFSYEHNISPNGSEVVGRKIAEYLVETTEFKATEQVLDSKTMSMGIPTVNIKNGNEIFYYQGECIYSIEDGITKLVSGGDVSSEICLIGDCNTQRGLETGSSVISYLSHYLKYPVEYGGRCLPFDSIDRLNRIEKGKLAGKKLLIYVAFASAAWVRAIHPHQLWNIDFFYDSAFEK